MRELFLTMMFEQAFSVLSCQGVVIKIDQTVRTETICEVESDRISFDQELQIVSGVRLTSAKCTPMSKDTKHGYFSSCTQYIKKYVPPTKETKI